METLFSLSWWITAVVCAYIMNLLSAYTKPMLDDALASLSSRWRNRVQQKRAELNALLDQYIKKASLISLAAADLTKTLTSAVILFCSAPLLE